MRVVEVSFQVSNGSAIGTEKVGPGRTAEYRPDALIVPYVRAWGNKEGLAGLEIMSAISLPAFAQNNAVTAYWQKRRK